MEYTLYIGKSTSKNYIRAIKIAKRISKEWVFDEDDQTYIFTMPQQYDLETKQLMGLISNWKGVRAKIKGTELSGRDLNLILANNVKHLLNYKWGWFRDQGMMDIERGDFVLDFKSICEEYENFLRLYELSNSYDQEYALFISKRLNDLPAIVNPIKDEEWGYITRSGVVWAYRDGKWISGSWGATNFDPYSIVGVCILSHTYDYNEEDTKEIGERSDNGSDIIEDKENRIIISPVMWVLILILFLPVCILVFSLFS
ncbi:MAG: hypothetical protein KDD05_07375 [Psychroserpens sp.]|nr:hypothetical protein [Psychroserpens sp.]